MSASLHGDVVSAIGQQVEQMILQAKKDSEARVRHDLSLARSQLQHMENLIQELDARVARCARANGPGSPDPGLTVDRAFLTQKISALEQKWGSEVKALKQDLHRTILAHNHNSDLMRHHRDALDEARRKLDAQTQPKAEQVDAQIEKVDRMLRAGQAKQRALDALTERLTALEQQVGDMLPPAPMPSAFPGMIPGMPGLAPMMAQSALAQRDPAAKRAAKKDGEGPTEEEVRARLLQAARKDAGEGASNFNAEAPVFVPRGTPSTTEAAGTAATATAKPDVAGGSGQTGTAAAPAAASEGAEKAAAGRGETAEVPAATPVTIEAAETKEPQKEAEAPAEASS